MTCSRPFGKVRSCNLSITCFAWSLPRMLIMVRPRILYMPLGFKLHLGLFDDFDDLRLKFLYNPHIAVLMFQLRTFIMSFNLNGRFMLIIQELVDSTRLVCCTIEALLQILHNRLTLLLPRLTCSEMWLRPSRCLNRVILYRLG